MAAASAPAAGAPPGPWPVRLQERLEEAERAVAALLAVCEEPDARAALEARDLGYSSAALLQQLEAASLSQRIDLAVGLLHRAQGALAPRPAAGDSAVRLGASGFASLPHAVALRIFAALPADARARAGLVSRAWRDAIAEPTVWTRLDLSPRSGVAQPVTDALLLGAAARAHGQLTTLRLEECVNGAIIDEDVLDVLEANAGSLCELFFTYTGNVLSTVEDIEAILQAAPHLRSFETEAILSLEDATRVLINEPPFETVRLSRLDLKPPAEGVIAGEDALLAFAAAVSAHAPLHSLYLDTLRLSPAVCDALSAAALTCRLRQLVFNGCGLSPACVPALARLLRGGSLTSVQMYNHGALLLDMPAAEQLGNAFAASRQLLEVHLCGVRLWDDDDAAVVLLRSLTGHCSLRTLVLGGNYPPDASIAGAALGAIVFVNSAALRSLDVEHSTLGDPGIGPLMAALRHNTHLRELICNNNGMSAAFARARFLSAVRDNTSLRKLVASEQWGNQEDGQAPPAVLEAEALVAARAADDVRQSHDLS